MRLLLVLLLCIGAAPAAWAQQRVALVIGNGAYRSVQTLPNPPNDAKAVADRLKRLGFDVTLLIDGDKRGMDAALQALAHKAPHADVAMLFYAGHGVQVEGRNYLVPVDAHVPQQTQDLRYDFVNVDAVMDALSGARKLRIVVLDACRDNPIAANLGRSVGRSLGDTRGLAAPADMDNTLIAYATAADATAADGQGAHSPFTQALLNHIDDPGLDIRLMFGRVRDDVRRATDNHQNPFVYVSLGGDTFDFNPGTATPAPVPAPPPPLLSSRPLAGLERPLTPEPLPSWSPPPAIPAPAPPPSPPPPPQRPALADLLGGRWRHSDGRSCGGGLFGTITLLDGALRFEWRLPGGRLNVAVERITAMHGNVVFTYVESDVGTPQPEVGHRNRYDFEADHWLWQSLTTGAGSAHAVLTRRALLAAATLPVGAEGPIRVASGRLRFGAIAVRCAVGRTGVRADKREGDGATPIGRFPLREVLYRPDRGPAPATALPVSTIARQDAWSDDPADPDYNRRVTLPRRFHAEPLWRRDALYDVLAVIGANDDPAVPGRGSAIFLHIARPDYGPTDGCLALARPDLLHLLALCPPGTEMVIA